MISLRILALAGLLLVANQALAQNVLQNPDFDVDLSGWDLGGDPAPVWDMLDIDAAPNSGSAFLVNAETDSNSEVVALSQCIETPTPGLYALALSGFIPTGQSSTGSVIVRSVGYNGPGCVGGSNASSGYFVATSSSPGSWRDLVEAIQVAEFTGSVSFVVGIRKNEDTGSFVAHVDSAMLLGNTVFSDSLE